MLNRYTLFRLAAAALLAVAPAAQAQFAVIDVASLAQLISEVQTLEQQLSTARNALAQAQQEYHSITGSRGMQQLLSGTQRNYLPPDWTAVTAELSGAGAYPALAAAVQSAMRSNALLSTQQLAALSPAAAAQLRAQRQSVALAQGLSHEALANSSSRFAALQQLIDAIGGTSDQKSILELQARIAAEDGMLQNENTKLTTLFQAVEAQQWANEQRLRELAIAGQGQFATRFEPHP
jgi:type IV secretion system protein VirB5